MQEKVTAAVGTAGREESNFLFSSYLDPRISPSSLRSLLLLFGRLRRISSNQTFDRLGHLIQRIRAVQHETERRDA